jgi:hypothetical protein
MNEPDHRIAQDTDFRNAGSGGLVVLAMHHRNSSIPLSQFPIKVKGFL